MLNRLSGHPTLSGGLSCTIGNPLNDGEWMYTWQNGRQLASMSKSGVNVSYKYNANGLRTRKIVNGVVTNYTLHGKNVVHMTRGNDELHFFYDAQNRPAVVVYNGTAYAYVKNLQGDIIAILDSAGSAVVRYTYDAWGMPTGTTGTMANTLGEINPFRYRGYVYDEETGLYYLRSRYCNPDWCRFVNCDAILTGNLFAYCGNCVIGRTDPDGYESRIAKEMDTWVSNVYYSFLTVDGCDNVIPIMTEGQFDFQPGQYVIVFYQDDHPQGLTPDGYYTGGLFARQVLNPVTGELSKYELISVLVKPEYLSLDLQEILFPRGYYESSTEKKYQVMPYITTCIDQCGCSICCARPMPRDDDETIRRFQMCNKLLVDGKIGPETLSALVDRLLEIHPLYNGGDPNGYRGFPGY